LGLIALQMERYQEAADYFSKALAAGQNRWELRQNLGITLFKIAKWPEALQQFQMALKTRQSPQTKIYLGLTYQKLGKPGLAIYFLDQALAPGQGLTPSERRDALNTLGYLYADEKQYVQAARAWSQTLALGADPVVSLNLAKMQRQSGQFQEALATLNGLVSAKLPPDLQAQRLDETAANLKEQNEPAKALEALTQANQLKQTPDRDYQIGLLYQKERQPQEAIPYLQKATSGEPENNHFKVALGYAYLQEKNYRETARLFTEVLRSDPDYLKLYPDLAYCNMHLVKNDQAVDWFKKAIDNQLLYPVSTPEEAEKLRQQIYQYRKEVSKITNRYDFTAYLSYTTTRAGQSIVPGVLGGGALPSQGGVEFAYQPPEIGFRDERIFQAFVRVLWNITPRSLRFDEDSFQGGVGLRYKPLQTQNFYLWGERLFKIGNNALDTWLLRLLYSWD
jgi:adsorption protein A